MLDFGTTAFISILFLVDPPGTVPAFISLTAKYSAREAPQDGAGRQPDRRR